MVDLVVVGSIALDSVKTPFGDVKDILGGAATYSSVAASIFCRPGLVGVVGEDFPREHIDFLNKRNIATDGLEVVPGKTFRWSGYYEFDMNQAHTTDTQLNVFSSFRPKIPPKYLEAKYLFLANIDPVLQLDVFLQLKNAKFVALDTMNFWISTKRDELMKIIGKVNLLLINDAEARQLMNTPNLVRAARMLLKVGPDAVIIKKGEHGALLFTDGMCFSAPAYPLEDLKDPTGAGDSFAGGIMGYLASTDDVSVENMRKAIIFGSSIASFNAEDFSLNKLKKITRDDILKRYKEFERLVEF
ncbi:MAG: PfkB family carbohydrate kinase [archaeon]